MDVPPLPPLVLMEFAQMQTSSAGVTFIAGHEGVKLKAYLDVVGVLTVGVGHTSAAGPPVVKPGMTVTRDEAYRILASDLARVERDVAVMVATVKPALAQHEMDALHSLVFNIGQGAFARSAVLKHLRAGDRKKAADAFLLWNKGGKPKRVIAGLANRRRDERRLFLTADYGLPTPKEHRPDRSGPAV